MFEIIAAEIDEATPSGGLWRRELLTQMMIPLTDVRPVVLTRETVLRLDEYLRFRHLVRHTYAFRLDAERVSTLVADLCSVYDRVRQELVAFSHFLERLSQADNE